jgi:hypothetical protein
MWSNVLEYVSRQDLVSLAGLQNPGVNDFLTKQYIYRKHIEFHQQPSWIDCRQEINFTANAYSMVSVDGASIHLLHTIMKEHNEKFWPRLTTVFKQIDNLKKLVICGQSGHRQSMSFILKTMKRQSQLRLLKFFIMFKYDPTDFDDCVYVLPPHPRLEVVSITRKDINCSSNVSVPHLFMEKIFKNFAGQIKQMEVIDLNKESYINNYDSCPRNWQKTYYSRTLPNYPPMRAGTVVEKLFKGLTHLRIVSRHFFPAIPPQTLLNIRFLSLFEFSIAHPDESITTLEDYKQGLKFMEELEYGENVPNLEVLYLYIGIQRFAGSYFRFSDILAFQYILHTIPTNVKVLGLHVGGFIWQTRLFGLLRSLPARHPKLEVLILVMTTPSIVPKIRVDREKMAKLHRQWKTRFPSREILLVNADSLEPRVKKVNIMFPIAQLPIDIDKYVQSRIEQCLSLRCDLFYDDEN